MNETEARTLETLLTDTTQGRLAAYSVLLDPEGWSQSDRDHARELVSGALDSLEAVTDRMKQALTRLA